MTLLCTYFSETVPSHILKVLGFIACNLFFIYRSGRAAITQTSPYSYIHTQTNKHTAHQFEGKRSCTGFCEYILYVHLFFCSKQSVIPGGSGFFTHSFARSVSSLFPVRVIHPTTSRLDNFHTVLYLPSSAPNKFRTAGRSSVHFGKAEDFHLGITYSHLSLPLLRSGLF